jgi:hypothetical protein
MKSDAELRIEGLRALCDALGFLEAERFVSLILREPFDYTQWQRTLWPERSVSEISEMAMESRKTRASEQREASGAEPA